MSGGNACRLWKALGFRDLPFRLALFIAKFSLSLHSRKGSNSGWTPKPIPLGGSSHSAAVLIEGDKAGI